MAATNRYSPQQQKAIIAQAAKRYGIPAAIEWGVYGTETSFGKNISNSGVGPAGGAKGPFQFEDATAKSLGVNPLDFKSAAFGAAKYLSQFKGRGTAGMLSAYNAGPAGGIQQNYVNTVLKDAKSWDGTAPSNVAAPTTRLATKLAANTTPATGGSVLDTAAFQQAQSLYAVGQLQKGLKTFGPNPLLSVLPQAPPQPGDFLKQALTTAATTTAQPHAAATTVGAGSGHVVDQSGQVTIAQGANRSGANLQKPVLSFLHELAGSEGRVVNVTTGTNHNQFVAGEPGVQSDHWTGNAADLGLGGDARSNPTVARQGDLIAAHAIALAGKVPFKTAYSIAHAGGVHNFQTTVDGKNVRIQVLWKTLVGGNHYDHVHVGVAPR